MTLTSRRPLIMAIAGFLLYASIGVAQQPDSRPADRKPEDKPRGLTLQESVDAARAKRAAGDLKGALAAYDEAMEQFFKDFDKLQDRATGIIALYREALAESDKLVEQVETPEFEAAIPERDMLSAAEREVWGKAPGIDLVFGEAGLEIKTTELPGKKVMSVASIAGWRPPWHDFVLDLEFKILAGRFELLARYWPDKRSG